MRKMGLMAMALMAALAGCASAPMAGYKRQVNLAHWALQRGEAVEAADHIREAKMIAKDTTIDTTAAQLLSAEIKLRHGKAPEAARIAQGALKKDADNPRAIEVLAKSHLQAGRFAKAEEDLLRARAKYRSEAGGRRRVDDLLALTRGLEAYGRADLAVARKYWSRIRNADLRYAVDVAAKRQAGGER